MAAGTGSPQEAGTSPYKPWQPPYPSNPGNPWGGIVGQPPPPATGMGEAGGPTYDAQRGGFANRAPVPTSYSGFTGQQETPMEGNAEMNSVTRTAGNHSAALNGLNSAFSQFGSPFSAPGSQATPTFGLSGNYPSMPAPPQQPQISATSGPTSDQLKANRDATFANVKDSAANTSQAAMIALQGELQRRGMGGAGYEGGQIGNTLGREANQIGAGQRQEAQTEYDQELSRANLDTEAQIAQRGQNIGQNTATRGQDIGYNEALRGQDLSKYGTDTSNALGTRGQNIGYQESVNNINASRQQQILSALLNAYRSQAY